jgi:hypothetical protein
VFEPDDRWPDMLPASMIGGDPAAAWSNHDEIARDAP